MQLLLALHITLLSLSLIVTSSVTIASLMSKNVSQRLMRLNLIGTIIGLGCGGALLLAKPLGSECLMLLGYLAIFSAAHFYTTHAQRRTQTPVLN